MSKSIEEVAFNEIRVFFDSIKTIVPQQHIDSYMVMEKRTNTDTTDIDVNIIHVPAPPAPGIDSGKISGYLLEMVLKYKGIPIFKLILCIFF